MHDTARLESAHFFRFANENVHFALFEKKKQSEMIESMNALYGPSAKFWSIDSVFWLGNIRQILNIYRL